MKIAAMVILIVIASSLVVPASQAREFETALVDPPLVIGDTHPEGQTSTPHSLRQVERLVGHADVMVVTFPVWESRHCWAINCYCRRILGLSLQQSVTPIFSMEHTDNLVHLREEMRLFHIQNAYIMGHSSVVDTAMAQFPQLTRIMTVNLPTRSHRIFKAPGGHYAGRIELIDWPAPDVIIANAADEGAEVVLLDRNRHYCLPYRWWIAQLQAAGLRVWIAMPYPSSEYQVHHLVALGVDGIITADTREVRHVYAQYTGEPIEVRSDVEIYARWHSSRGWHGDRFNIPTMSLRNTRRMPRWLQAQKVLWRDGAVDEIIVISGNAVQVRGDRIYARRRGQAVVSVVATIMLDDEEIRLVSEPMHITVNGWWRSIEMMTPNSFLEWTIAIFLVLTCWIMFAVRWSRWREDDMDESLKFYLENKHTIQPGSKFKEKYEEGKDPWA